MSYKINVKIILEKLIQYFTESTYPGVPDNGCPWIGKQTLSDRKCKEKILMLSIKYCNHKWTSLLFPILVKNNHY